MRESDDEYEAETIGEYCEICEQEIWSDGACSPQCPNDGNHKVEE